MPGKGKNSDSGEAKPASSFVHLSYKALSDFDDLRKGEDVYYAQLLRTLGVMLGACTLGAYVAAKSFFFQDWIGAAVICVFLTLILANSPVMNKTARLLECLGIHFFTGCCISTVLWWNFSFNHWNIIRVLAGFTLASFLFQLPLQIQNLARGIYKKTFSQENRRASKDTNRLVFAILGPLAIFAGLYLLDLMIARFLGVQLLLPQWRIKVALVFGVWGTLFGQFLFMKSRLYDHDVYWQMVLLLPETLLSLFLVPKTIVSPETEDDC